MNQFYHYEPAIDLTDIEKLREKTQKYISGELSSTEFRSFRVPLGVYEQRQKDVFMLRVRIPDGVVTGKQLRALAKVSHDYGNNIIHVSTRQDIQIHGVSIENLCSAVNELFINGLSTKGGGGNTVRNITGCYLAGVCKDEVFDITPHALTLTQILLKDNSSFLLPRKFKICFSGCEKDCAGVMVNDLGFVAKKLDKEEGFSVYVGGGMGAISIVANLLEEFIPANQIHIVAESVKRVYYKYGDRKNKHKNRLRFLIEKIGFEKFKELYIAEREQIAETNFNLIQSFKQPAENFKYSHQESFTNLFYNEDFKKWLKLNVSKQKQEGFYIIHLPLILGDISSEKLSKLSSIAHDFEVEIRTTQYQNLVLRWVAEHNMLGIYQRLTEAGLADPAPCFVRNLVACAGASTCQLGICLSRNLANAVLKELTRDGLNLDDFENLKIHISGCPNSCGRHPIADIGLFGVARRVFDHLVPFYTIQIGGEIGEGKTNLAKGKETVPAFNIPKLIKDFLKEFRNHNSFPDYKSFIQSDGENQLKELVKKYKNVPPFEEDKNFYYDWGATSPFSLVGRGPGECGAGVFDLIKIDIESAKEALENNKITQCLSYAVRSLLVTRGEEPINDAESFRLFKKYFLDSGIINNETVENIITKGIDVISTGKSLDDTFKVNEIKVLIEVIEKLHENIEDLLNFQSKEEAKISQIQTKVENSTIEINKEVDFRKVTCPLNYVKTKMVLFQMKKGDILSVLLDDAGARSVPESAEKDGNEVLQIKNENDYYRVLIRKK